MLCLAATEPLVLQVRLPQPQPEGVPAAVIAAAVPGDASTAEEVVISDNDDDDFQPGSNQKVAPRTAGQLCPDAAGYCLNQTISRCFRRLFQAAPQVLSDASRETISLFPRSRSYSVL